MATATTMNVVNRSATTAPMPVKSNPDIAVAKLIDESKCIGCKACQVACMQWNDNRDEIGNNVGVYDNPSDLTTKSWTVMRFNEVERADGGIDWLIRKDGCMHCEDPGCLKACPAPGAIVKYENGIVDFVKTIASAAAIASRVAPLTFRGSARPITRPTSARCAPIAWRWARGLRARRPVQPRRFVSARRRIWWLGPTTA